ncbi:MAG TPA: methyltransferase domain-containing protein [Longimicrobium sp.]|nr:methyltransferase domain-containing protein [Longimicrobium sp.]
MVDFDGINQRPDDIFALSEQLLTASQNDTFPYETEVLGVPIVVLADVFSPRYIVGAEPFTRMLNFTPGIDFLEIGPGTGAISVHAALAGARVLAIDINPAAVANTQANIDRHGLAERMEVREGDVFEPLRPGEAFDLIFWNVPFGYVEPGVELTPLRRSTLDPGYEATRRYVHQGRRHLKPGGRLVLGFSSVIGRLELVERIAAEAGLEARITAREEGPDEFPMPTELIEFFPRDGG